MKLLRTRRPVQQQIDLFAGEPQNDWQHAGVVHAADGHTSGADQLDNTIDPGARRRETDWLNGGDRS